MRNFAACLFVSLLSLFFLCSTWAQAQKSGAKKSATELITYHLDGDKAQGVSWPDHELKSILAKYWGLRMHGPSESAWAMEAPYFREMVQESKYMGFLEAYAGSELTGIGIYDIQRKTDHLVIIQCGISFVKNGKKGEFFIGDRWVKVGNKWYHVLQDPILFPAAS